MVDEKTKKIIIAAGIGIGAYLVYKYVIKNRNIETGEPKYSAGPVNPTPINTKGTSKVDITLSSDVRNVYCYTNDTSANISYSISVDKSDNTNNSLPEYAIMNIDGKETKIKVNQKGTGTIKVNFNKVGRHTIQMYTIDKSSKSNIVSIIVQYPFDAINIKNVNYVEGTGQLVVDYEYENMKNIQSDIKDLKYDLQYVVKDSKGNTVSVTDISMPIKEKGTLWARVSKEVGNYQFYIQTKPNTSCGKIIKSNTISYKVSSSEYGSSGCGSAGSCV